MLTKVARQQNTAQLQQRLAQVATRDYQKVLTKETIHDNIKDCQYAVRGAIPIRGEEIMREIGSGKKFPFPKTTPCNIGNPQAVGQGHMTFNREVLSTAMFPTLVESTRLEGENERSQIRKWS